MVAKSGFQSRLGKPSLLLPPSPLVYDFWLGCDPDLQKKMLCIVAGGSYGNSALAIKHYCAGSRTVPVDYQIDSKKPCMMWLLNGQ